MPGIFGYYGDNNNNVNLPKNMQSLLDHGEYWFSGKYEVFSNGFLGVVDFKNNLLKNLYQKNGIIITIFGNIYSFNEKSLTSNSAKEIFDLYKKYKLKFIKNLNGSFLISVYDNGLLILINDKLGSKNLFYYTTPDKKFIYSSEIKAILADGRIKPNLNYQAISELFTFSFPLKNHSYFKGINLLPSASILIRDHKTFSIQNYWTWEIKRNQFISYDIKQLLNEFDNLMNKSIYHQIEDKDKLGVFLSGGLDSRLIAAFTKRIADKTGKELISFTLGTKGGLQEKIVKKICKRLKLNNIFFEIPSDTIAKFSKEVVYKSDGLIRIRDAHFIYHLKDIRKIVDTALIGLFCSELFGELLSPHILTIKSKIELINYIFRRYKTLDVNLNTLFKAFPKNWKNNLKKEFLSTFDEIPLVNYDEIFDFWEINQRDRRYIIPLSNYFNWYLDCRLPFIDDDVIEFALNLPLSLRIGKKFIHLANKYLFPNLSDIPWEKSRVPPAYYGIKRSIQIKKENIKNRLFNGIEKYSLGLIKFRPNDYKAYKYFIKTGSKNYIQNIFNQNHRSSILNLNIVNKILKDHLKAKMDNNQLLCDLLQIELLYSLFF